MKTLFRSQDLWEIVEDGVLKNEEEGRMQELKKRDAKALFFIQQGLHETVFSRVSAAKTAKEAWKALRNEFQGTTEVKIESTELESELMKGRSKLIAIQEEIEEDQEAQGEEMEEVGREAEAEAEAETHNKKREDASIITKWDIL
ncbi:hypothetical protein NL676_005756 [Syzygium grande]|nr:hypothetical protein NL676_005756 [Syzygium grande]